jgi:hypothetical protein
MSLANMDLQVNFEKGQLPKGEPSDVAPEQEQEAGDWWDRVGLHSWALKVPLCPEHGRA